MLPVLIFLCSLDLIPPHQPDPLTRLWLYFCDVLCNKQVPPHVTNVYNVAFAELPWERLNPNTQVLGTMMQVCLYSSFYMIIGSKTLSLFLENILIFI